MGRNFLMQGHFILHPIQDYKAIALPARQGQISFPHALVELNGLLLKTVLAGMNEMEWKFKLIIIWKNFLIPRSLTSFYPYPGSF